MSNNIYVGNLSWDATESELENLFSQYGEVSSARIITDKHTDRSKGFGFVEMPDNGAATEAISALDGNHWLGRNLKVNISEKREQRGRNEYSYR